MLFRSRVAIFESNSQVSEQFVIELNKTGQLVYRYSYANFDGASERREATLSPTQ